MTWNDEPVTCEVFLRILRGWWWLGVYEPLVFHAAKLDWCSNRTLHFQSPVSYRSWWRWRPEARQESKGSGRNQHSQLSSCRSTTSVASTTWYDSNLSSIGATSIASTTRVSAKARREEAGAIRVSNGMIDLAKHPLPSLGGAGCHIKALCLVFDGRTLTHLTKFLLKIWLKPKNIAKET